MSYDVRNVPNVKAFMVFQSLEHVRKAASFYKMQPALLAELESCLIRINVPCDGDYLVLPTIRPIIEGGTPSFPRVWYNASRGVYYYNPLVGMCKDFDSGPDLTKGLFDMFPTVEKYFDKLMGRQAAHRSGV